jgi:hypothetical protein
MNEAKHFFFKLHGWKQPIYATQSALTLVSTLQISKTARSAKICQTYMHIARSNQAKARSKVFTLERAHTVEHETPPYPHCWHQMMDARLSTSEIELSKRRCNTYIIGLDTGLTDWNLAPPNLPHPRTLAASRCRCRWRRRAKTAGRGSGLSSRRAGEGGRDLPRCCGGGPSASRVDGWAAAVWMWMAGRWRPELIYALTPQPPVGGTPVVASGGWRPGP